MNTSGINDLSLPDLYRHLDRGGLVRRLLELARDEDLGPDGDVTSGACIPEGRTGRGAVVARAEGVVAGLACLPTLLEVLAPLCRAVPLERDGARVDPATVLATLDGPVRQLLALERTMLNLLSRLSGVATLTRRYVQAMPRGTPARLYDTRKTTPGLRVLEKYAVRCGGANCHRVGLYDAVLIKDNHLESVPPAEVPAFVERASRTARARGVGTIEVEVDTHAQLDALLTLPRGVVDIALLDNFALEGLRRAADARDAANPALELEASGGVTLVTLDAIARTGVDRISVGALTHQAVSIDIAFDLG